MAHGFSLANCDYFAKNDYMHPLIKSAYTFLRTFGANKAILFQYNFLGMNLEFAVYSLLNRRGDIEYCINVFCNNYSISGATRLSSDDTDKFNELLALKPLKIELVDIVNKALSKDNRVDITSKLSI